MKIIVREIIPDDYPQTIEMIKRTHLLSFTQIYPMKLIEELIHKYDLEKFTEKVKGARYFVAEDRDSQSIKGLIGLRNNELRTFFVDPESQGRGIGRKLFSKLEEVARSLGLKEIVVEGSSLGLPIYEKFGFVKIKEIKKEKVGVHYSDTFMKKDLT